MDNIVHIIRFNLITHKVLNLLNTQIRYYIIYFTHCLKFMLVKNACEKYTRHCVRKYYKNQPIIIIHLCRYLEAIFNLSSRKSANRYLQSLYSCTLHHSIVSNLVYPKHIESQSITIIITGLQCMGIAPEHCAAPVGRRSVSTYARSVYRVQDII